MDSKFLEELDKGSKNALIKRRAINYYIDNGNTTIPDLSKELGLSVPTVTKMTTEMCDDGLLLDYGKVETSGGRYPSLYGLNPDAAYFVGVDLKKYTLDIALMDFRGDMLKLENDIPFQPQNTLASLKELTTIITNFIDNLNIDPKKILNINLSLSGRVNSDLGYSYSLFLFDERPLTETLKDLLGYNVSIDNDTRAMTYGEYMAGNVSSEKNVIFVNVSWGLAIGIIIDGKLYKGKSGFAGEFGHIPSFQNEVLCHCGKKGCLETEASGSAVLRLFNEKIASGATSILSSKVKSGKEIVLEDIIAAANKEDMLCIEIIEDMGEKLGRNIAGLINLLNPELVVIGGVVSLTGEYLTRPIETAVKKFSLNLVNRDSKLVKSKLKDKAGIVGSCLLARAKIFGDE